MRDRFGIIHQLKYYNINELSKTAPVFFSFNMSLGINLLIDLCRSAYTALGGDCDIEITEKHHRNKLDAPSGTALMLANEIKEAKTDAVFVCGRYGHQKRTEKEIGIHALRMGGVIGEHEVILATPTETITLKHEAHSRSLFAEGAIAAADFIKDKSAGLYDMYSMIGAE